MHYNKIAPVAHVSRVRGGVTTRLRIAHLSLRLKMFQFGSFGHQGNSDFFKSMRRRQMRASTCQARASQRNFAEIASNFTNHDGHEKFIAPSCTRPRSLKLAELRQ